MNLGWLTPEVANAIFSLVILVVAWLLRNRIGATEAEKALQRFSAIRQATFDAVLRVEQEFGRSLHMTNEERLNRAIETAFDILTASGITLTTEDMLAIKHLIETAVKTYKAQGVIGKSTAPQMPYYEGQLN